MVEELLELSRIESGEVPLAQAPVDMNDVVTRAVARLQPQADKQAITLKAEPAAVRPIVTGDADRLERAVVNLVHNAIKFTPPDGWVDVRVLSSDGDVTVSVTDSGTGIAPEDVPRIFERFYKADQARHGGGTGLGLAVVKHTVEAHGGAVTGSDGTRIRFDLHFRYPFQPLADLSRKIRRKRSFNFYIPFTAVNRPLRQRP